MTKKQKKYIQSSDVESDYKSREILIPYIGQKIPFTATCEHIQILKRHPDSKEMTVKIWINNIYLMDDKNYLIHHGVIRLKIPYDLDALILNAARNHLRLRFIGRATKYMHRSQRSIDLLFDKIKDPTIKTIPQKTYGFNDVKLDLPNK